jgi:hypothetical protein
VGHRHREWGDATQTSELLIRLIIRFRLFHFATWRRVKLQAVKHVFTRQIRTVEGTTGRNMGGGYKLTPAVTQAGCLKLQPAAPFLKGRTELWVSRSRRRRRYILGGAGALVGQVELGILSLHCLNDKQERVLGGDCGCGGRGGGPGRGRGSAVRQVGDLRIGGGRGRTCEDRLVEVTSFTGDLLVQVLALLTIRHREPLLGWGWEGGGSPK